ncbi:dnaJ homolog subfamily C member 4-like [Macrobrachium rosenbergii]|uniref:dnaJ homolog subfamily C member 4-like n=1 Tax=Macrobrachium rosenbergii TaxID=79674 RepID=UPI0034D59832
MQSKGLERLCFGKRLILGSLCWHRYLAARMLSASRASTKTHYEVLGVKEDCTASEIKDSFIRLSKEMHPDKNPDRPGVHENFVLINEAYSVLSKPHERRMYDAQLVYKEHAKTYYPGGVVTNAPRERVVFHDDSLWESRDRGEDKKYEGRSYYGIKGVRRLPNNYIAFGAIIFALLGGLLHFYIAMKGSKFAISQLDERDRIASQTYKAVRQRALNNGNELQKALLLEKMEGASQKK